jgi:signal transduction histidine kinase
LDPIARHHEISVSCHSDATVRVDRYRIFHVLMNLLRNAVQATGTDQPIAVRTLVNDSEAVIEIEDHGHGMSPEVLDQIFTPFFTTKGKTGTGLGLRMSKSAVERHGGGLECVSTPGDGTCFRVRLPMVTVGPVEPTGPADASAKRPTGS